jgi:hypothetical protein
MALHFVCPKGAPLDLGAPEEPERGFLLCLHSEGSLFCLFSGDSLFSLGSSLCSFHFVSLSIVDLFLLTAFSF